MLRTFGKTGMNFYSKRVGRRGSNLKFKKISSPPVIPHFKGLEEKTQIGVTKFTTTLISGFGIKRLGYGTKRPEV